MVRIFILLFTTLLCFHLGAQDSLHVRKVKSLDRGSTSYSGSWVYVNASSEEYGLVGSAAGTAIYPLEEGNDEELAFISGPNSRWREITVIGDHAYVTTEGNGENQGLQVLDLSQLPDTAFLLTTYDSTFTRGHILQKDIYNPDEPYIYISGTDSTGSVHILDVSDPAHPVQVGLHAPGPYIHDVHVRGDRMYTFQFFEAIVEVVDISDKTNPVVITTFSDPGGATHSGWTTEDNNFLLVADERDGFDGRIFDIRDLSDISEVSTFTSNPNTFVHNPYVRGDFAYLAHNREGLRVYDVVDPSNPVEVGYYDTVTDANPTSGGLWSACPFVPSGKVIGGDRDLGLVVWEIEEVYASRFSGIVRDAESMQPLDSVKVSIAILGGELFTNGFGVYKGGIPGESDILLVFEKEGYITTSKAITLSQDNPQIADVLLEQNTVSTLPALKDVEWDIHPNPAHDFVRVNLNTASEGLVTLRMTDFSGRPVSTYSILDKSNINISTQSLANGVYTLSLLDANGHAVAVKKLSVLR
jgi:choice-of-anchor B domain-containing protein